MRTPAKKHTHILRTLFGFALSLLMLVPFAMIVLNTFKNKKEAAQMGLALPKQWSIIENYRAVMETGVVHAFRNSCIVTLLSVLLIVLFSALAAFVFHWSVPAVYVLLMSDELIKVPITLIRYRSFKWLKDVTRDNV